MCEGLSKISSNFTLHLIKVGKLKRFKKVLSDLKTILKTNLANLRFLSFEKGEACQSILKIVNSRLKVQTTSRLRCHYFTIQDFTSCKGTFACTFPMYKLKTGSCVHKLLRASKNELSFAQLLAAHVMFAKKGEKFHF